MSAPVVLALPALELRLTDAGGGRVAVWLAAVGSAASERVATVEAAMGLRSASRSTLWRMSVPETLRRAIEAALDAHFTAATP